MHKMWPPSNIMFGEKFPGRVELSIWWVQWAFLMNGRDRGRGEALALVRIRRKIGWGEALDNREARAKGISDRDIWKKPTASDNTRSICGQQNRVRTTEPALTKFGCSLLSNTPDIPNPQFLPTSSANSSRELEERKRIPSARSMAGTWAQ